MTTKPGDEVRECKNGFPTAPNPFSEEWDDIWIVDYVHGRDLLCTIKRDDPKRWPWKNVIRSWVILGEGPRMRSQTGQLKQAWRDAEKDAAQKIITALEAVRPERRLAILKAACLLTDTKLHIII